MVISPLARNQNNPKPAVVARVVGIVAAAARRAEVPGTVVPGTAAQNTRRTRA